MKRDRDTLYLDYMTVDNIQSYIKRDGLNYLDALKVEVEHLNADSLDGLVNIKVDDKTKGQFGDLIEQLETVLKEYNNIN